MLEDEKFISFKNHNRIYTLTEIVDENLDYDITFYHGPTYNNTFNKRIMVHKEKNKPYDERVIINGYITLTYYSKNHKSDISEINVYIDKLKKKRKRNYNINKLLDI